MASHGVHLRALINVLPQRVRELLVSLHIFESSAAPRTTDVRIVRVHSGGEERGRGAVGVSVVQDLQVQLGQPVAVLHYMSMLPFTYSPESPSS